jgi:hypothetical protein
MNSPAHFIIVVNYELPNSGTKSYFSSVSDQGLRYPRRLTPTFGTKFYISSSLSEIELYK